MIKKTATFCILYILSFQMKAQLDVYSDTQIFTPILSPFIAGQNIVSEIESSTSAILLNVNILPNNTNNTVYKPWKVSLKCDKINWHDNLNLQVKLTGNGTSLYGNKAYGSLNYIDITDYDFTLVTGTGWINEIPFQLKLNGLSVMLPAQAYSLDLVFTLTDD